MKEKLDNKSLLLVKQKIKDAFEFISRSFEGALNKETCENLTNIYNIINQNEDKEELKITKSKSTMELKDEKEKLADIKKDNVNNSFS